ncbi:MAG: hypothetical protein ACK58T_13265, partial [Phycisphaerae bacterium]
SCSGPEIGPCHSLSGVCAQIRQILAMPRGGNVPLPGQPAVFQACGMTAPNIAESAENKK